MCYPRSKSLRISVQSGLLRELIRNLIELSEHVPEANLDIPPSLLAGYCFVQAQEQVEIGGFGIPSGAKVICLSDLELMQGHSMAAIDDDDHPTSNIPSMLGATPSYPSQDIQNPSR